MKSTPGLKPVLFFFKKSFVHARTWKKEERGNKLVLKFKRFIIVKLKLLESVTKFNTEKNIFNLS